MLTTATYPKLLFTGKLRAVAGAGGTAAESISRDTIKGNLIGGGVRHV